VHLWSDVIVWEEWVSAYYTDYTPRVVVYNTTTKTKEVIVHIGVDDIFKDNIVFAMHNKTTGYDIYLYNLTTGEEVPICTDPGDQQGPKIWGDYVVWHSTINGTDYWEYYNLRTGERRKMPKINEHKYMGASDIYGDRVVGTYWISSKRHWYLYLYDIGDDKLVNLSRHLNLVGYEDYYQSHIYKDIVVWVVRDPRGHKHLHLYNISRDQSYEINLTEIEEEMDLYSIRVRDIWENRLLLKATDKSKPYPYPVDLLLLEFQEPPPPPEKKPQADVTLPVTAIAIMVIVGLAFLYNGLRRGQS